MRDKNSANTMMSEIIARSNDMEITVAEQSYRKNHYQTGCILLKTQPAKGAQYIYEAAQQKDPVAQHMLACLYEIGYGVEKSMRQAYVYYEAAAKGGNALAQYRMGNLYETGKVVKKDVGVAATWYLNATLQFHPQALNKLKTLAVEHNLAYMQLYLAKMYEQGNVVTRDVGEAQQWYELAAKNNKIEARKALARLCGTASVYNPYFLYINSKQDQAEQFEKYEANVSYGNSQQAQAKQHAKEAKTMSHQAC